MPKSAIYGSARGSYKHETMKVISIRVSYTKKNFMLSWAGLYPLREKITAMTTRLKTTTKTPPSHTKSSFCFMRIKPPTVSRFGPPGGPFISRVGINLVSGGNDSGVLGSENS